MEPVKKECIFYQMTHGCTCLDCDCPYCCSCKKFKYQFMDCATYMDIAEELSQRNDWEKFVCKNISPFFLNTSLRSKLKKINIVLLSCTKHKTALSISEKLILEPIFENYSLFSLLLIPNGKELSNNDYCLSFKLISYLFNAFETHLSIFSCFQSSFNNLLTFFYEYPKQTIIYVRGLILLTLFLPWINNDDNKNKLILFVSCIIPVRVHYFNELARFSFLFKSFFFTIVKYLKSIEVAKSNFVDLMQTMYEVNQRESIGLDAADFVIPSISRAHSQLVQSLNMQPVYPYLLTHEDFIVIHPQTKIYQVLPLKVRREYIVQDTFINLMKFRNNRDLKNTKLSVEFEDELAEDMGGVSREFITIFMKEILKEELGYFVKTEIGQYWFNFQTNKSPQLYYFIGMVAGFAYTARIPIGFSFSSLVYKKLFNMDIELGDLKNIEPCVYKSLKSIRKMAKENKRIEDLDLVFTIVVNDGGKMVELDLVKGGSNIPVDNDNYEYYINLYTNYIVNERVDRLFNKFKEGFIETSNVNFSVNKASPLLFKLVLEGKGCINWENFRKSIVYSGWTNGYQTVNNFWDIFSNFSEDKKRLFLKFVTGMSTEPLDGFHSLNIHFVRGGEVTLLPTSHTCVNQFILPDYKNYNILLKNLNCILENADGFGFI